MPELTAWEIQQAYAGQQNPTYQAMKGVLDRPHIRALVSGVGDLQMGRQADLIFSQSSVGTLLAQAGERSRAVVPFPTEVAPGVAQYGSQFFAVAREASFQNGRYVLEPRFKGMERAILYNLARTVGSSDSTQRTHRLGRAIRQSTIHTFQDVAATPTMAPATGRFDLLRAVTRSRQAVLYLDDTGERARSISALEREFAGAQSTGTNLRSKWEALEAGKSRFLGDVLGTSIVDETGRARQVGFDGIKDPMPFLATRYVETPEGVMRQMVSSAVRVSLGGSGSHSFASDLEDAVAGEHHLRQALGIRDVGMPGRLYTPGVAGSEYGEIAREVRRLDPRVAGFSVGSNVGYVAGPDIQRFWLDTFGESGALGVSKFSKRLAAQATDSYIIDLPGYALRPALKTYGARGFLAKSLEQGLGPDFAKVVSSPGETTYEVGRRLWEIAGADRGSLKVTKRLRRAANRTDEQLADAVFKKYGKAPRPMRTQRAIARAIRGRDTAKARLESLLAAQRDLRVVGGVNAVAGAAQRTRRARSIDDMLERVTFTDTGLRLHMRAAKARPLVGTMMNLGGTRATARFADAEFAGLDWLFYDPKMSKPANLRRNWLEHFRSRVYRQSSDPMAAMRRLAGEIGAEVGEETIGGRAVPYFKNVAEGSPLYRGDFFGSDNVSRLERIAGVRLAPDGFRFDTPEGQKFLRSVAKAGFLDEQQTEDLVRAASKGPNAIFRFDDISTMLRSNTPASQAKGAMTARLRMRHAQQMLVKFRAADGVLGAGAVADAIADSMGATRGRIEKTLGFLQAPLLQDARQAGQIVGQEGFVQRTVAQARSNPALRRKIMKSMDETGMVSEGLMDEFLTHYGMDRKTLGVSLDISGSGLEGKLPYTISRPGEGAVAGYARSVNIVNPVLLNKEFGLTGTASGVAGEQRIAKSVFVTGKEYWERKSLSPMNSFMLMLDMMDPDASHGNLSRRLIASAISAQEAFTGGKGMIRRDYVKGFKGSAFVQQTINAEGNVVMATEDAVRNAFGRGEKSYGDFLLERLRKGEKTHSIFARHPTTSAAQNQVVELRLISQKMANEMVANGVDAGRALFVSRSLQHLTQGDVDGDTVYLMFFRSRDKLNKSKELTREMFQETLSGMASQEKAKFEVLRKVLSERAEAKGLDAAKLYQRLAAGGDKTFAMSAFLAAKETLGATANTGDEVIAGLLQRTHQYRSVGGVHSWAGLQRDVLYQLAGKRSVYKVDDAALAAARGQFRSVVGLDPMVRQETAYVESIYRFLKKGKNAQSQAVDLMENLFAFAGGDVEAVDRGVKVMGKIEESIGTYGALDDPRYTQILRETDATKRAALTEAFNREQFLVMGATLRQQQAWTRERVGMDPSYAIGRGRAPRDMGSKVSGLLSRILGVEPRYAEDLSALSKVGEILPELHATSDNVKAVTGAAAEGLAPGVKNLGGAAADAFTAARSTTWGKVALWGGGAVLALAAAKTMFEGGEEDPGPVTISTGSSPMPPQPILGSPQDGVNADGFAGYPQTARIQRVVGQRRQFGSSHATELTMPEVGAQMPQGYASRDFERNPGPSRRVPRTRTEALAFNRDF